MEKHKLIKLYRDSNYSETPCDPRMHFTKVGKILLLICKLLPTMLKYTHEFVRGDTGMPLKYLLNDEAIAVNNHETMINSILRIQRPNIYELNFDFVKSQILNPFPGILLDPTQIQLAAR